MRLRHRPARFLLAALAALVLGACSTPGPQQEQEAEAAPVIVRPVIVAERGSEEMQKAIGLLQLKNYPQAEANFEEIVKVRPDIPEAHFNLAWVKQKLGKHAEVPTHIANGLKLRPEEISAYLVQALSERELGQFPAAETTYLTGLALAADDARLHLNIGILYDLYMQRPKDALGHYKRYQELQKTPDQKVGGWIVALERVKAAQEAKEAREAAAAQEAAAKAQAEAEAAAEAGDQKGAEEVKPAPEPTEPAAKDTKKKKGKK